MVQVRVSIVPIFIIIVLSIRDPQKLTWYQSQSDKKNYYLELKSKFLEFLKENKFQN